MVMKVEPIFACVERVAATRGEGAHLVFLTPRGPRLTQEKASELAGRKHLLLLCGHYEGVDERVMAGLSPEEVDRLVFRPGLSTSPGPGAEAGRGVGLDSVLAAAEFLEGTVEIENRPGEGVRVRLVIPDRGPC